MYLIIDSGMLLVFYDMLDDMLVHLAVHMLIFIPIYNLVGGFNPSEKYESQLGWLFPIYENVPNNQPAIDSGMLLIFSEIMILFSVYFLLSFLMLHHYWSGIPVIDKTM